MEMRSDPVQAATPTDAEVAPAGIVETGTRNSTGIVPATRTAPIACASDSSDSTSRCPRALIGASLPRST